MTKEQKYQLEASEEFAGASQTEKVAPHGGEEVPSAGSNEGGQPHEQQEDVMPTRVEPRASSKPDTREQEQARRAGQESPFLNALVDRGIVIVLAQELIRTNEQLSQENEILAVKAGKWDKQRQQTSASYYRQKEADPKGSRERAAKRKALQRERERQAAETQEVQKPQDNHT